ncbi:MAG: helix-turn-helix domain-containing protein [Candidatus Tisiphia sp.]
MNLHNLARNIGFSNNSLSGFINSNRGQKTLNSQIVVALADYFQVSIDEMIGRIKPTTAVNSSDKNSDSNTHL